MSHLTNSQIFDWLIDNQDMCKECLRRSITQHFHPYPDTIENLLPLAYANKICPANGGAMECKPEEVCFHIQ